MVVLADNDIVHKLACCNLLSEFLSMLGCPPTEVHVLPTMQYVVRRKLKGNDDAIAALQAFLTSVVEIVPPSMEAMERFKTLDIGEQQLFGVLCEDSRVSALVTGDKRALRLAAGLLNSDAQLKERLAVVNTHSLESVMIELIDRASFSVINDKVTKAITASVKGIDGVLQMAFGVNRSESHCKEALGSYLTSLKAELGFMR
jgi:predicted nucleic acid-binding protein